MLLEHVMSIQLPAHSTVIVKDTVFQEHQMIV